MYMDIMYQYTVQPIILCIISDVATLRCSVCARSTLAASVLRTPVERTAHARVEQPPTSTQSSTSIVHARIAPGVGPTLLLSLTAVYVLHHGALRT